MQDKNQLYPPYKAGRQRCEKLASPWGNFKIERKTFLISRTYGNEFGYEVSASRDMPGMHCLKIFMTKDELELPELERQAYEALRYWVGV